MSGYQKPQVFLRGGSSVFSKIDPLGQTKPLCCPRDWVRSASAPWRFAHSLHRGTDIDHQSHAGIAPRDKPIAPQPGPLKKYPSMHPKPMMLATGRLTTRWPSRTARSGVRAGAEEFSA